MKTLLKKSVILSLLVVAFFYSCNDNDNPAGAPPKVENMVSEIKAEPGQSIVFEGTFTAENGFSRITLSNTELSLDKQIVFANHVEKYFLEYKFTIPQDAEHKVYEITISAENLSGESEAFNTKLDVATPPTVNVNLDFKALPGETLTFEGTISDEQGLTSIKLVNAGIGLDHTIDLPEHPKSYDLSFEYAIPNETEMRSHNGTIAVENIASRKTTLGMKVNLSGEDVVYENLYVAGGFQWWTWRADLAYPMERDPQNEKWFEVLLHCWDGEFEELKFLGQLNWNPDNWGLADQTDPSKGVINDENSQPILLGANGGNPAYKKVRFNPYSLQYSIEDYTADIAPRAQMYIMGKGFPQHPALDWNPDAAIPMIANPDGYGEHIFMISGLEFSDDVDLKFIGQTDGWGPYDAGFDVEIQEITAPATWVKVKEGSGTKDLKFKNQAGTYTILFDYYLKRASIWKEE